MDIKPQENETCLPYMNMDDVYFPAVDDYVEDLIAGVLRKEDIIEDYDLCGVELKTNEIWLSDKRNDRDQYRGMFDVKAITDLETDWEEKQYSTGEQPPTKTIGKGRHISDLVGTEWFDKYRNQHRGQLEIDVTPCIQNDVLEEIKRICHWKTNPYAPD